MPTKQPSLLSPRTADRLTERLAKRDARPAASPRVPVGRYPVWVKVTGPKVGNWHPCVVSLAGVSDWIDEPGTCECQSAGGPAALTVGARYLAIRQGDADGGRPRFRIVADANWTERDVNGNETAWAGGLFGTGEQSLAGTKRLRNGSWISQKPHGQGGASITGTDVGGIVAASSTPTAGTARTSQLIADNGLGQYASSAYVHLDGSYVSGASTCTALHAEGVSKSAVVLSGAHVDGAITTRVVSETLTGPVCRGFNPSTLGEEVFVCVRTITPVVTLTRDEDGRVTDVAVTLKGVVGGIKVCNGLVYEIGGGNEQNPLPGG